VGGRILTLDGFDMGPSWVWKHQHNILKLIKENKLELFTQHIHGQALYDTPGKIERFTPPISAPSRRIKGGIIALVKALENTLILDTIKLNSPVYKIEKWNNELLVSTVSHQYKADIVINTLPPRLALSSITYSPKLPLNVQNILSNTPTWMGASAKCTIIFKTAFWRMQGLSGFGFSHVGPLGELHDACTHEKSALFGFFQTNADKSEKSVREQMQRLFGKDAEQIEHIYIMDWSKEKYTTVEKDHMPMRTHPQYGYNIESYEKRLLFSGTEASYQEGGYLEGCICSLQKLCNDLECNC